MRQDLNGDTFARSLIAAELCYDFVVSLGAAIAAFTDAAVAADEMAYRYRGADLRHVIERLLYFSTVNDEALLAATALAWRGDAGIPANNLPVCSRLLAPFLSQRKADAPPARTRRLPWWLTALERDRREGFDRRSDLSRYWTSEGNVRPGAVLFLVIQYKFVRFLSPVAERFKHAAYLVVDDAPLAEELRKRNLPYVHVQRAAPPIPQKETGSGLAEFTGTAAEYDAVLATLQSFLPECVVIPEGNAPVNELTNQACKSLGIPTVCIQQGWSPVVHQGFRNMSYSTMLVWGAGFATQLKPWNPGQRFESTGHHLVHVRDSFNDKTAIGFFPQTGGPLLANWSWAEFLNLIDWAAQTFSDREIIVRDHPSSSISEAESARLAAHPNLRFMPPDQYSLDDVLNVCGIGVAIYSTTIIEAMAAGTAPLIANFTGMEHYNPNLAGEGAAIEVGTPDDARAALTRLCGATDLSAMMPGRQAAVRRYFAHSGDVALENMVRAIRRVIGWRRPWLALLRGSDVLPGHSAAAAQTPAQ